MSSSEDEDEIRERIRRKIERDRTKEDIANREKVRDEIQENIDGALHNRQLEVIDEDREYDFSTPEARRKYIKKFDRVHHGSAYGTAVSVYTPPDKSYEIDLVRKRFKVQKKFETEDALYSLRIEKKKKEGPKLVPLFDILFATLEAAAGNLKDAYKETKGKNRQVFVCVEDQRITGGLNTGAISLDSTEEEIAQITLDILANYLQSYKNFRLEGGFEISFKVLSPEHAEYRRLNDGFVPSEPGRKKVKYFL